MKVIVLILILILAVVLVALLLPTVKAILSIVNIKQIFTCKECGEVNNTLKHNCNCVHCGKYFIPKNVNVSNWENYLYSTVSEINTSLEDFEYNINFYIKDKVTKAFLYGIPCAIVISLIAALIPNMIK